MPKRVPKTPTSTSTSNDSSKTIAKTKAKRAKRQPKTIDQKIQSLNASVVPLRIVDPVDFSLIYLPWDDLVDNLKRLITKSTAILRKNAERQCICTCGYQPLINEASVALYGERTLPSAASASNQITTISPKLQHHQVVAEVALVQQSKSVLKQSKSLNKWTHWASKQLHLTPYKLTSLLLRTIVTEVSPLANGFIASTTALTTPSATISHHIKTTPASNKTAATAASVSNTRHRHHHHHHQTGTFSGQARKPPPPSSRKKRNTKQIALSSSSASS
jgi:hypothetical protein